MDLPAINSTIVVTVTYGERWHYLSRGLESALHVPDLRAIVVDNGAPYSVATLCAQNFPERVSVITLAENTGSAGGFKAGLQAAFDTGVEYILLLDDDNLIEPAAISRLRQMLGQCARETALDKLAVLGFRPEHQPNIAQGIAAEITFQHPDSYFNFHVKDILFKLWRRRPGAASDAKNPQSGPVMLPERIRLNYAPYSGMLFHRSVIENIGLPDEAFIVYADDTDFSYRITQSGGAIWLIPSAPIADLEQSWNVKTKVKSTFEVLLSGEGDRRAYYSTRNQAFFERHRRPHRRWMRAINRVIYLTTLSLFARRLHAGPRHQLLLRAMREGEAGRLGRDEQYPLQGRK